LSRQKQLQKKQIPHIVKYSLGLGSTIEKHTGKKMPRRKDPGHFQ
jgi:hypothetical protein